MAEQESNTAILIVDVIDSLHADEQDSDAATLSKVRDCLSLVQQLAIEGRGRVVMTTGDCTMCEFPDADAAALAACEMQNRVQKDQSTQASGISIRIGLHRGPPLTAGVTAQRMAAMAASGQIITTSETKAQLSVQQNNAVRQHVLPAGARQESVVVYEVLWQQDPDQTQMPGRPVSIVPEATGPRLRLIHAGREIVVVTSISMGRRDSHGITLKNVAASRDHAHIERRKGKFVLVDHSSHGTFLRLNNGYEHKIWRNEMILRGSGVLSFAQQAREKGAELVSFWCESIAVVATPRAVRGGAKRQ